jgi:vitamin K-dependent gamma-carboxylase
MSASREPFSLRERLSRPVDGASLVAFRVLFGLLMAASALRFVASGWVERFFVERTFFFKYWGFSWVEVGPPWLMYGVYSLLVVLGLCVALGFAYRAAIVLFLVLFSYAELTDVTNYLNHYYLVSLLAFWMCFMPLGRRGPFPAWMLYALRFQVAVVYLGAALAKLGSDWLVHGQPLGTWMTALADVPGIGRWVSEPGVAVFASWAGFLHDLLVVPLLLWPRTRAWAYGALLVFHLTTSALFNIGIFPLLMPIAATLFLAPDWPRRFFAMPQADAVSRLLSRPAFALLTVFCAAQVLVPLRAHLYGGNVLWHEQGMRFSWRVMVRAKQGSIRYRARLPDGRELYVMPRRYLSSDQEREMSGQPDLILQLAHHIAAELRARGIDDPQVRVDALVSLNGRPPVPLIDPNVDLTKVHDGLAPATWITPAPVALREQHVAAR